MLKRLSFAAVLVVGIASTAGAESLVATPALSGIDGGGFVCWVQNVSNGRQKVKIQLVEGNFVPERNPVEEELGPGATVAHTRPSSQGGTAYCLVTIRGSKSAIRVSLESRTDTLPAGQTIAAVQGQ